MWRERLGSPTRWPGTRSPRLRRPAGSTWTTPAAWLGRRPIAGGRASRPRARRFAVPDVVRLRLPGDRRGARGRLVRRDDLRSLSGSDQPGHWRRNTHARRPRAALAGRGGRRSSWIVLHAHRAALWRRARGGLGPGTGRPRPAAGPDRGLRPGWRRLGGLRRRGETPVIGPTSRWRSRRPSSPAGPCRPSPGVRRRRRGSRRRRDGTSQ